MDGFIVILDLSLLDGSRALVPLFGDHGRAPWMLA
jgi:hypothetical protein